MKDRKIGIEIKTVDSIICRRIMSFNKDILLTPIQIGIIKYILDNNMSVYQKDIEMIFNLRRSTISGILSTMEKNKLIVRIDSNKDARSKEIKLTDKCLNRKKEIISKSIEFENILSKGITDKELDVFFNVMDKIKKNLEEE